MKLKKYTLDELKQSIISSHTLAEVLRKLKIVAAGGNYQTIKTAIKFYNLDTSHFTGMGHLRGKTHNYNTRPLNDILIKGKFESSDRLRKRLIKEKLKEHKCEDCQLYLWKEKPIPLELHHIDADRTNHEISNIQLLCPNCHALTDNYRGKNKSKSDCEKKCLQCLKLFPTKKYKNYEFCSCKCANIYHGQNSFRKTKIQWLPHKELQAMVDASSFLQVGKKLGVSDNAVRKRLRNHKD